MEFLYNEFRKYRHFSVFFDPLSVLETTFGSFSTSSDRTLRTSSQTQSQHRRFTSQEKHQPHQYQGPLPDRGECPK